MTEEKARNFAKEYEEASVEMQRNFIANKINAFLIAHQKINKLFTDKLQYEIDNKTHLVHEHILNPELEKKLDDFSKKYETLISNSETLTITEKIDTKEQTEVDNKNV